MLTSHRHVGVKIPQDQLTEQTDKPNLHVAHAFPVQFYAAQYVENGKLKMGLFFEMNGDIYLSPNSDEWLGRLSRCNPKLAKNIKEKLETLSGVPPEEVPIEDNVDVVAADMATESPDKEDLEPSGVDIFGT